MHDAIVSPDTPLLPGRERPRRLHGIDCRDRSHSRSGTPQLLLKVRYAVMKEIRFENRTFENIDVSKQRLSAKEYDTCAFVHCDMSGADLSHVTFSDCTFMSCDLSNALTAKTVLHGVLFSACKLLGVHFDHCNTFLLSMAFENCNVDFSSFFKVNLRKTTFNRSTFHEADFSGADLTGSLFDHCDLSRATFNDSILEKADLRTSYNYVIDPEANRVKKAKVSMTGLPGLLQKYDLEIE
jgi:fluoroquinolone resistance protein